MAESAASGLPSPFVLGGIHDAEVESFDSGLGLGALRLREHPAPQIRFQCMVISDGSREVAAGARVAVQLGCAPDGSLEARLLHKVS